jgi:hypothetical protein
MQRPPLVKVLVAQMLATVAIVQATQLAVSPILVAVAAVRVMSARSPAQVAAVAV